MTPKREKELLRAEAKLMALEAGGVDNLSFEEKEHIERIDALIDDLNQCFDQDRM